MNRVSPDRGKNQPGGGSQEGDPLLDATLEGLRRADRSTRQEHQVAQTLQRSLLPEALPEIPGFSLAARYQAGSSEARVGGDWYDVVPLSDGRVGVVIGDVAGHGIKAAARMGHLQSALRAYALGGDSPAVVLELMNRYVRELEPGAMATLVYALLELDGMVRISVAGHPPPLLLESESGSGRLVTGEQAPPLGVATYPGYEETVITLGPGSSLVLYTDGLIERPGRSLDEGLERLLAAGIPGTAEPEALCERLLGAMLTDAAADDVAVVAVQLKAAVLEFERVVPADPRALAPLRQSLNLWLNGIGVSADEVYDVLVACGEACTNAIQHAYPPGDATFRVSGVCENGTLEITVSDRGRWRARAPGSGGLGLLLMQGLMDSVDVDTGADGSNVILRRRFGNSRG